MSRLQQLFPNVRFIRIDGYWNEDNELGENSDFSGRLCAVVSTKDGDNVVQALLDLDSTELFYVFYEEEGIVGEHTDFTVTNFTEEDKE